MNIPKRKKTGVGELLEPRITTYKMKNVLDKLKADQTVHKGNTSRAEQRDYSIEAESF